MPLTVGYHKVTVDIRDQIARTTIEESFVNHTERRARRACSTSRCRRTRRSPASACGSATSWSRPTSSRSSGPARSTRRSCARSATRACSNGPAATSSRPASFRSPPHSREADQDHLHAGAAAARANRYRYSYALQSELLQQHPLRELTLDVTVNSRAAAASVSLARRTRRASQPTEHAGPRRVLRPGVHADARLRGRRRASPAGSPTWRHPAPPRRRRLLPAAAHAAGRRRRLAARRARPTASRCTC